MSDTAQRIREIVTQDVDPDFLRTMGIDLAWRYAEKFETISRIVGLDQDSRHELFSRQRGDCAVQALVHAAIQHGVPYNFRRLACNGQSKLLLKAGRVAIIQEPMISLFEAPRVSEYKRQLADSHGFMRQLELDLGDQPGRIIDWSGNVLATLLHGTSGRHFSQDHMSLGGLMLGVPDASYSQWALRLDLQQIAMFGTWVKTATPSPHGQTDQVDRVNVLIRHRNKRASG